MPPPYSEKSKEIPCHDRRDYTQGQSITEGGMKEKILAAKRADIKEIIISEKNRKDDEDIKEIYIKGLKFHYVGTIMGVLDLALLRQKVNNPKNMSFE